MLKPLALTLAIAVTGFSAYAAGPAEGYAGMGSGMAMHEGTGHHGRGHMDPAKMQARMDKRNANLKSQLKITESQEAAWATYVTAMKPPATMMAKSTEWAEIAKLPTPERIDKMKALRSQRMAEMGTAMDKHGEATKALYAALTPEQQKVFDTHGKGSMGGRHHGSAKS
jgi:Spy/CpxP family protein refolding chaperone